MKTNVHSLPYFAQLLVEWETFPTNFIETLKKYILFSLTLSKIVPFMR